MDLMVFKQGCLMGEGEDYVTVRFSFSSIKSLGFLRSKLDELCPTDFKL